ncbi:MAG: aromatic-ring-hydroxylating dioxygenase subunit beta [Caulobacterales bacterium]|jgi:anthranilate 1,2-dioxygenase small subunit|nr:aromatic-ring-hydroxylating dioxygenase subunit beta [Caulobacterales bacterium]
MGQSKSQLRAAVRDFYEDYAATLDADRVEAWPAFFTEDALYQVISRESHSQGLTHATIYCNGIRMIRDRGAAIRQTAVFEQRVIRHFISNVQVSEENGEIRGGANFLLIESLYDREPQVLMVGEYIDVLVRDGDGFKLKQRSAVYDNYRVRTTLVLPV